MSVFQIVFLVILLGSLIVGIGSCIWDNFVSPETGTIAGILIIGCGLMFTAVFP